MRTVLAGEALRAGGAFFVTGNERVEMCLLLLREGRAGFFLDRFERPVRRGRCRSRGLAGQRGSRFAGGVARRAGGDEGGEFVERGEVFEQLPEGHAHAELPLHGKTRLREDERVEAQFQKRDAAGKFARDAGQFAKQRFEFRRTSGRCGFARHRCS